MGSRSPELTETRLRKLVIERKRREKQKGKLDPDSLLFGPQKAFVNDISHLVAAWCSRRAGKTHGLGFKLIATALMHAGCTVLYITNTRRQAKRIMWDLTLLPLLRELDIPFHPNQNELQITLNNGSRILMGGANDASEIETYRGIKTPLVVLDEAQSFRSYIAPLITEILDPATIDYDGQILMTGTPNASCFGFFHDVCKGATRGWSVHNWTLLDNPHIPHAKQWLEDKREREGIAENDPAYLREWCGVWVRDTEGLVFGLEDHHVIDEMPDWSDREHILGIDFGYADDTAFVVQAFSQREGKMCTVESYTRQSLIPSDAAIEVKRLEARYDFEAIVGDVGGLGKGYAEEMIQRYGIPVEPAEKRDKVGAIELINGDLRRGLISIYRPANEDLVSDLRLLQWNYDKIDRKKQGGHVERSALAIDDSTPDHLADAWLYAYRKCRHYITVDVASTPEHGSSEYWAAIEDEIWAQQGPQEPEWSLAGELLAVEDAF